MIETNDNLESSGAIEISETTETSDMSILDFVPTEDQINNVCDFLLDPVNFVEETIVSNVIDNFDINIDLLSLFNIFKSHNKLNTITSITVSRLTGLNISDVLNDFSHHGHYFSKTIHTTLLILDIIGYTNPITSIFKIGEKVYSVFKKLLSHHRKVNYYGIEFIRSWEPNIKFSGYSTTTRIDNDILNIHIKVNKHGRARNSRLEAEKHIKDEIMYHTCIPKDCLELDFETLKNNFEKFRVIRYENLFKEKVLKYYLDKKYITKSQYDDALKNPSISDDFNKNINLTDEDKQYLDKMYEDIHKDYLNHQHSLNDMKIYLKTFNLKLSFTDIIFLVQITRNTINCLTKTMKNNLPYGLLKSLCFPTIVKYGNKFIVHNLNLFTKLSPFKMNCITSILPVITSIGTNTYEFLTEQCSLTEYCVQLSGDLMSIGSSVLLSTVLVDNLIINTGITISISLKTGIVITTVAKTAVTSAVMTAGTITVTVGAATIKAFGIGAIIMGVGLLIIGIQELVLYFIMKYKNRNNKKDFNIHDNIFTHMNRNIYDYINRNIYMNTKKNTYNNIKKSIISNTNKNIFTNFRRNIFTRKTSNKLNSITSNCSYTYTDLNEEENLHEEIDFHEEDIGKNEDFFEIDENSVI